MIIQYEEVIHIVELENDFYWFWLCNIAGIGNVKAGNMLEIMGTPREIYNASKKELSNIPKLKQSDIENIIKSRNDKAIYENYISLSKSDSLVRFISVDNKEYPDKLKNIVDKPYGLYVRGRMPDNSRPIVSIIGARECSSYGMEIAGYFGKEFAKLGIQVISGMARGIDSSGQWGAIEAGKSSYAVLGCGVDICYPRQNIDLYMNIIDKGGLISEYPPKTPPNNYQFPMRNRIISGMSDTVVVVEARKRSGSLITVDMALEQNRNVMVVPGRIGDKLSEGCNNLIKLGAQVILEPDDILENLMSYNCLNIHNTCSKAYVKEDKNNLALARVEKIVYSDLSLMPKSIDSIMEETGLSLSEVTKAIVFLELNDYIKQVSKNTYVKNIS